MKTMPARTVFLVMAMSLLLVSTAFAAQPVTVEIKGQLQPITGYLRELSQALYILQSDDGFFQFGATDLVSVNGKKSPDEDDLGTGRLIYSSYYEKIQPNGDVELWMNLDIENTGRKMIASIDWGAKERELEQIKNSEIRDQFGNVLLQEISQNKAGGFRVEVRLPVPVAPMESISLSKRVLNKGAAKPLGEGNWQYTFNCDFSEDRFFVRKIELPTGSKVEVPQGWWLNEVGGRLFLHSYFYIPAHTVSPQVVKYQLP